jgi:hypothetical protein
MSTQSGQLSQHRSVQVPMWLIVALVLSMLAIGVGYSIEQYQSRGAVSTITVKAFPDTQVAAREGAGAVITDTPVFPGGLETSGVIPAEIGGAYPDTQVAAREGAPVGTDAAAGSGSQSIVIDGSACHQCR